MDNSTVQYAAFIVAALILIWGVIEINRRFLRRKEMDARTLDPWVHLDASQPDAPEDGQPAPPTVDSEPADSSEQDMRTRARQNGHYSESKRGS